MTYIEFILCFCAVFGALALFGIVRLLWRCR